MVDSVTPTRFIRNNEKDIFIATMLIILAFIFKPLFFIWFNSTIGDSFFIAQQSSSATIFRVLLLSPNPAPTQGYDDVWYHYIPYVEAFVNGWNPYSPSGLPEDSISGYYNYGPLYIILISLGTLVFGMSYYASILFSNMLFDSLNCGLLYLILVIFISRKKAFVISLFYLFSPVMLYYVDYKLLNLPQMTFFTLLFLLSFLHDRHQMAMICLALSFVIKLIPIFFLFPLFFYYKSRFSTRYIIHLVIIFLSYSLAILLPFLVDNFQGTVNQFFLAGTRISSDSINFSLIFSDIVFPNFPLLFGSFVVWMMFRFGGSILINDKILMMRVFIFYILWVHGSFYPLYSRGFKYYHGYLYVFYLFSFFVLHQYNKKNLPLGILLTYLVNVLIFSLPIGITSFHHRRVFWIYYPGLLMLWIFSDLKKIKALRKSEEVSNK